jgi:hypothetical protein
MRLSVITDEISPDLEVALRECEAMDISTVELRSVGGAATRESVDSLRELAAAAGIELT